MEEAKQLETGLPDRQIHGGNTMHQALQEAKPLLEAMEEAQRAADAAQQLAPPPELTPRSRYAKRRHAAEQTSLQLMMHLDRERINSMEQQFERRGGSVGPIDFIRIMLAHLPEYVIEPPRVQSQQYRCDWQPHTNQSAPSSSGQGAASGSGAAQAPMRVTERALVANLDDLFREIDINGDGDMEWEEFTSFIVEKAVVFKQRFCVSAIGKYQQSRGPGAKKKRGELQGDELAKAASDAARLARRANKAYAAGLPPPADDEKSRPWSPTQDAAEERRQHFGLLEKLHYVHASGQVAALEARSPVVTVFDANEGRISGRLEGHLGVPTAMQSVTCHGTAYESLVTCCADSTMCLWNLEQMNEMKLKRLNEQTHRILRRDRNHCYELRHCWPTPHVQMCLSWVESQGLLFSGSCPGLIHSWDLQRREERACIRAHNDIVMDLVTMEELDNVVSASLDRTVSIWDTHTHVRRQELRGHKKGVLSLAYSADYKMLVSAGFDHDAYVWSPFVPTLLFTLKGHSCSLIGVEAVPGTPEVITADTSGYFKLWDLRNFTCVQTWTGDSGEATADGDMGGGGLHNLQDFCHIGKSSTSELHESGSRIVASTKQLIFFDQGTNEVEPVTDDMPISCACYNSLSLTLLTASESSVKIWCAISGNIKQSFAEITPGEISAVCLDDRKRKFIIGDSKGNIGVFNYSNGALMKRCTAQPGIIRCLLYCDAQKAVISATSSGVVAVHDEMDPDDTAVLREMDSDNAHTAELTACAFSHALSLVATGSADNFVKIWDFETGKLEGDLEHCAPISAVGFCGDYPIVVSADTSGVVRAWGTRMSMYKWECCFAFVHGVPEAHVTYESEKEIAIGRAVSRPTILPAAEVVTRRYEEEREVSDDDDEAAETDAKAKDDEAKSGDSDVSEDKPEKEAKAAQVNGYSRPAVPSNVMSLAFDTERTMLVAGKQVPQIPLLITADDDGCIQRWDMAQAFSTLALLPVRLPKGDKVRRRASFVPHLVQKSPPPIAQPVRHVQCVQAHTDGIKMLAMTQEPLGLLTVSYDRTVSFFDRECRHCGVLLQGLVDGLQNPQWSLPLDVSERATRDEDATNELHAQLWLADRKENRRPSLLEMVQARHEASAAQRAEVETEQDKKPEKQVSREMQRRRRRVISALESAKKDMEASDDEEDGADDVARHMRDEWTPFASTLPPLDTLSTEVFSKLIDRSAKSNGEPSDQTGPTAAQLRREVKERKRAAGLLRNRSELLLSSGKVLMQKTDASGAYEPGGPAGLSSDTCAAVEMLANAINEFDDSGT